MVNGIFLVTFSCFIAFLLAYFTIDYFMSRYREKSLLSERLSSLSSKGTNAVLKEKAKLFQKKRSGLIEKKLHGYLTRFKSENWLQLQLYRSGLSFSLLSGVVGFVLFIILLTSFSLYFSLSGLLISFFISVLIVSFLTWFILSFLKARRQKLTIKHLPTAIDMILRSLKSGYSIEKTFIVVAKEMHPSVAEEFQQIVQQMNIGVSYEDALHLASERVHTSDFYFLVNALIIQRQTGGSLAETLENILYLLHRRHEIRLKTLSLSAEAKTTGIILGAVPIVIWIIIMIVQPEYMDFFLYDNTGVFLLKIIIGLLVLEALIIKWLTNIKIE